MLQRIRDEFFRVGWMLPILVPAGVTLGRAMANILFFSYFLWAILALRPSDFRIQPTLLRLYALMVAVFLISTLVASLSAEALHTWFRWAAYTLALPVTLAVLARQAVDEQRLLRWFAVSAAVAGVAYLVHLAVGMWQGKLIAREVNGMSMAYLMPFLLYWLYATRTAQTARWALPVVVCIALTGLLYGQSSTELLVIGTGFVVMLGMLTRYGTRVLWAGALLLPAVLAIELIPKWSTLHAGSMMKLLEVWSSFRTTMWFEAFSNPPDNILLGAGMGNAQYADILQEVRVKGFHNFLVDVWYELGLLGLSALLALLFALFIPVVKGLRAASDELRRRVSPWLASIASILVAASLDHSYGSVSFALIMLFELAVVHALLRSERAVVTAG